MKSVYGRTVLAVCLFASVVGVGLPLALNAAAKIDAAGRLLDSRAGGDTVDSEYSAFGTTEAGERIWLQVAGRSGVPDNARFAALNVTAVNGRNSGYVTVDGCAATVPNTSNLNFQAGQTIANLSMTELNSDGMACIYTSGVSDLVVDVAASFPNADFSSTDPSRMLDTRNDGDTVDGRQQRGGSVAGGNSVRVDVAGRADIPTGVDQVVVNLTSVQSGAQGFMTAHDCDDDVPNSSDLNYLAGQNVSRFSVVDLDADGGFCLYSSARSGALVDVFGYFTNGSFTSVDSARLVETRANGVTDDGEQESLGQLNAGGTLEIDIAGRGGVPANARAVLLQVASVGQPSNGFVTLYPQGEDRPNASNFNFAPRSAIGNSVIVELGGDGNACLYSSAATHVVVDVVGYFPGSKASNSNESCPTTASPSTGGGNDAGGNNAGDSGSGGGSGGVGAVDNGVDPGNTGGGNPGSGDYDLPGRGPVSAGSILTNPAGGAGPSSDGTGNFRLVCGYSHMAYNDPIVLPGQVGASHLHTFFGNTGTDANSTYSSLRNSGNSTCDGGTANRSAYWIPSLISGNEALAPDLFFVYYKSGYRAVQPNEIQNIPNGLRMVAGNAMAGSSQSSEIVEWFCNENGGGGTIPSCPAGGELRLNITFPQCWNGRDLDSADHKSHMAYPGSGSQFGQGCPSSHPIALPVITMNTVWNVPAGGTGSLFLASDPMAGGSDGESAHADFFEAWDPEIRDTFTEGCVRSGWDCGVRLLGNGQMLTMLSTVPGLPRAVAASPLATTNEPVRLGGVLPEAVLPRQNADGEFYCSLF